MGIMIEGFPVEFDTEVGDLGLNRAFCGVSSFGFGGANARCDLFNQCTVGPRKVREVDSSKKLGPVTYTVNLQRPCGPAVRSKRPHVIGTFNAWSTPIEMQVRDAGVFGFFIKLSAARWEEFQI